MRKFKHGKLGLVAFIFILISFFGKIVLYPCKSSPVITVPKYIWKLCNMDILGRVDWVGVSEKYFGFNQGKIIVLILNFVIAYLIVSLILKLYKKWI